MRWFSSLVFVVGALSSEVVVNFAGQSVYRLLPTTQRQVDYLEKLQHERTDMDFWKPANGVGLPVDIHVDPDILTAQILPMLRLKGETIEYKTMVEDIGELIKAQHDSPHPNNTAIKRNSGFECISNYQTAQETKGFLDTLAAEHADIAKIVELGETLEGEMIRGMQVSTGGSKPIYYIDGGIHAREWIAPAVVKNFLLNLLSGSDEAKTLLDMFDWVVVPIVNIDGYKWTWTNNRLWRKTRRPNPGGSFGVDPNRNSDINFGGQGSSSIPTSETYHGPSPFSEPCVAHTKDFIVSLGNVKAYWNYHAYGQDLFIPFGYTTQPPENNANIVAAADLMAQAILSVEGMRYRAWRGNSIISGDLSDYLLVNVPSIQYSGVPELRDTGRYGFILPESQICGNSEEIWQGMIAHARYVANN